MLTFDKRHNLFTWRGAFETRDVPRRAGFEWSDTAKCWYAASPYLAYKLYRYGDVEAKLRLSPIQARIEGSAAVEPVLYEPWGLYPFQAAGVEYMADVMRHGLRRYLLLSDDPGLGKTCQAIRLAAEFGLRRLLVICPASLRLNWVSEIKTWAGTDAQAYVTGAQPLDPDRSVVTSYALADKLKWFKPEFIIVDESHNIKNLGAQRTQLILGNYQEQWRGLIADVPAVFLSGTPIPNGRPNELYPLLRRCAPDAIGNLKYYPFINRYCNFVDNEIGGPVILGAKNKKELFIRLRGSGFMTRRLKKDVLKDLPPKRFKMVVFTPNAKTRAVLVREQEFSAKEIVEHGVPVGTALPELRREMGIAKVSQVAEYVGEMLDGGVQKVVLFCHHIEVVSQLCTLLAQYGVVYIVGFTGAADRQKAVTTFQTDASIRVFIGNKAAEEGVTLTAAQDVVLVEPSWSPGEENQRADRLHRIGQTGPVLVHILVVEGSLDAKIMASAADKRDDINAVIDGE